MKIKNIFSLPDQINMLNNTISQPLGTMSQLLKQLQYSQNELLINELLNKIKSTNPDSLALYGHSAFSQNDEDGILSEIFKRLNKSEITFFEFGVAPHENNTLSILLNKGRGCWFDKGLSEFKKQLGEKKNLKIVDDFITLENIEELFQKGLDFLKLSKTGLDFLSLDLDGNDYYLIEKIITAGFSAKVICLEYNAKFKPPMDVKIKYDPSHKWTSDDYFGCSLQAYVNLLKKDYTLVGCNISGTNCFFVKNDFASNFKFSSIDEMYQPPRYFLSPYHKGHKSSTKFFSQID